MTRRPSLPRGYVLDGNYGYVNNGRIAKHNMYNGNDIGKWNRSTEKLARMGETCDHHDTVNQLVHEANM